MRRTLILTAVLAGFASIVPALGQAQAYPTRPIKLVVPWSPGGGTDVLARIIAGKLSEAMGQQVIVENKPGASSMIGMTAVAQATPDGYTFGLATSNLAANPYLYASHSFDVAKDLAPVVLVSKGVYAMAVNPALPVKSVADLIAHAKANPGKLNAALVGAGSPPHLALAQFTSMTGADIVGIHYKGAGPSMAATIAGETQLMFASYASLSPMVQADRLRLLAVTSAKRATTAPDVPTAVESGLPGFVFDEWYAVFAPAKTPRVAIDRFNAEVRKVLALPDVRERMKGLASEPAGGSPEELGEFVRGELARFSKLIKDNNIKAD
ncbi:tripartite tricarboxylate transporter substrate binding protein [Comamonadaceae bacterium G21597-S1]|nr:tripartite tricarboxylate transporter substrate binding protein [Comamonadaceae bacterium G21597-S1]